MLIRGKLLIKERKGGNGCWLLRKIERLVVEIGSWQWVYGRGEFTVKVNSGLIQGYCTWSHHY